jgi:hypothetical protein
MKKLFIFSDTHWSLGRVYRDIGKQLSDEYELRYSDWASYSLNELVDNFNWADVCITNLVAYTVLKQYSQLNLSKCIFVSHGYPEHNNMEYDSRLRYGMTSDSIATLFPSHIKPFLMPNGVDPDNFVHCSKNGELTTLGWCGADHVLSKQIKWAHDISHQTHLPVKIASTLSYDELKIWYSSIDLLLITSVPTSEQETGPLPAFEAIVSGIPVIGTPVGNFRHIPGPKFTSVQEAIERINELRNDPQKMKSLAAEQYEYVMNHCTYTTLVDQWRHALKFS